MRVALDVTPTTAGSTGVARYAAAMERELRALGVDVAAFAIGRGPHPAPAGTRRLRVPLRLVQRSWQLTDRPRVEHLVGRVDVAHCLDLQPAPSRAACVMTAHDLLAVTRPELHSARQVQQQHQQLRAMRNADLVLANSVVTAEALVDSGVPADRVVVTPLGVSPSPAGVVPHPGRYILAVGELASRKNLLLLIEAFRAARLPKDAELLLVGPAGHEADTVLAGTGGRVRALGRVDDLALAGLYAGATAFAFPSLAEGFGLPVLEALEAGAPVLASDLPVLHEVALDAARYLPAHDARAWSAALEQLFADGAARAAMAARGREVAAGRTWKATAAATLAAYERLLG